MQVEDRLSGARPDVDEHAVVLEAGFPCRFGDELEHALRLVGRKLADLAERVDMTLRQDEQMCLGLGVDVPDRDEPLGAADVIAFRDQAAKEAVFRQRGSPPR